MAAPILYMVPPSPPVRAVQMTAKALNLVLNEKTIDIANGEHKKPEFLKLNPQHAVPVLDDNGFILADSHAIMAYLVTKYGKNSTLLPSDPEKRAIVDQRLYYDCGTLFTRYVIAATPVFFSGKKHFETDHINNIVEAYGFLESFLTGNEWVAGDTLTIADYSIMATITSCNIIAPVDADKYPNVTNWMQRMENLPEYQVTVKGLVMSRQIINSFLA